MQFEEASNQISQLRNSGNLIDAIRVANEAASAFPDSPFFPKVAGDLYFQIGENDKASESFFEFLRRAPSSIRLFNDFAKRYYRLKRIWSQTDIGEYAKSILDRLNKGYLSYNTAVRAKELIINDLPIQPTYSELGQQLDTLIVDANDSHFHSIVDKVRQLESFNTPELLLIINKYLAKTKRTYNTLRIDTFLISVYERNEKYENALKLSTHLLDITLDAIVIRAMLRLSRKMGVYTIAQNTISSHPEILQNSSFNVLYELVYYYEYLNDFEKVKDTLGLMEKRSSESIPILSTLRNFYLKFGLYEEANRVDKLSVGIFEGKKKEKPQYMQEIEESAKEFRSEFEHRTRLAAISDLTTGISHELGQPITNIRYTIQFYKKALEKHLSEEQVFNIFDSILEETQRMGELVKRLDPITSTRSFIEDFDIVDRIRKRLDSESSRLTQEQIRVIITPSTPQYVKADPVKFDQVINNLLLNSIDAVTENIGGKREINVNIKATINEYRIVFTDTGVGIPLTHRGRIFEPFFSTKSPGKGSGLGLFIVWNILKIFGGSIALDSSYVGGARFIMTLPKDTTIINRAYAK